MNGVLAVILGGGRGSRLFPLTLHRSKPAVPIGGKYRLIDIPVSNCLNAGLRRIFVLTQYNSESLNKHLNSTYKFDIFSNAFVSVLAAEQTEDSPDWFQGTSDAVRQSLRHLRSHPSRDVLILSGDQLYQMDFRKMQETHRRHVAEATVAVTPVPAEATAGFGILKMNRQGRIVQFEEKPKPERLPDLVSEIPIVVGAEIERAIIGIRSRVGQGVRIREALVLGADYYETIDEIERANARGVPPLGIGAESLVERAIVDKNARIGRGVRLVNEGRVGEKDGSGYYIRDGIVIVPKDGVIADGSGI